MKRIIVSIAEQRMKLFQDQSLVFECSVSTALAGPGEAMNSGKTPRGEHIIRAKIGADQPLGSVFVGRRPTGEIWSEALNRKYPERDWILSRILWLSGCEVGFNRGGRFDSMRRYIYIHGTPDDQPMGIAKSHGCVRMRNIDMVALFDLVDSGCQVLIQEDRF
ncbi:L,D-transpeptidase [Pelagibaculum spongiae]|uniref:L,D-transpeptidase n=1 Tax=Pelagibaculum spongiae TaxID=2080658 RepID=A0A2V1H2B3_9GAMM|nr:L,D-transpeptidase [Pelagibaculum spongiae]PVZ69046.1 L,D-transpeptidase [Pelagibaculum spongiae]